MWRAYSVNASVSGNATEYGHVLRMELINAWVNRNLGKTAFRLTVNAHLGQLTQKPAAGLPTQVVDEKGRYHSFRRAFPQRGEYAPHFPEADFGTTSSESVLNGWSAAPIQQLGINEVNGGKVSG